MSKTIIFADDSATMRKVAEITFAGGPFELVLLSDGADVVAKAKERKPAVIILDTAMPGVNGYEACRQLRADGQVSGIPVLLLSGPTAPVDEVVAREVGASGHVVKPFETQTLIDKVVALAAGAAAEPAARQPAVAPTPRPAAAAAPAARPSASAKTVLGLGALGGAPAPGGATGRAPVGGGAAPPARPPATPPGAATAAGRPAPAARPPGGGLPPRPAAAARPAAGGPAAQPAQPRPAPRPAPAAAAPPGEPPVRARTTEMTPEEIRKIELMAREVIERVVWEVVPDLAETIIREALAKLVKD